MSKKLINHGIAIIGIAVFTFLSIASGASTPAATATPAAAPSTATSLQISNEGVFGEQIRIPIKDFEPVGLVFTEAQYSVRISDNAFSGDMFTYQALLKEAQRLRADAIINVVIDKRIERIIEGTNSRRQETWFGSALAIRYTTVLSQDDVFLNKARSYTFNGAAAGTPTIVGNVTISNDGVFGQQIYIPVKNFDSAGLVFTQVQYEIGANNITGDTFTYHALLKEADKLGAHAIINVVIDKRIERSGGTRRETWFASALAIKYTSVVRRDGTTLNDSRSHTSNGGTTLEPPK